MNSWALQAPCWLVIHLLLSALLFYGETFAEVIIQDIVVREEPGCIAQVKTNVGFRWIYLKDDYTLVKDSLYYSTVTREDDPTYLWRPCVPFDVTLPENIQPSDNYCQDTSVARNNHNRTCDSLGSVNNGTLQLKYVNRNDSREKATVRLVCNTTQSRGSLVCISDCGTYSPILEYSSKYVCLGKQPNSRLPLIANHNLSTGSLILIVGGFIFFVYLLVGVIRGTVKGRSGCDRLPNSDFWLELPLLVKDGCRLTFTCKLPRQGYYYRKRRRKTDIYAPIAYDDRTPVVDI